MIPLLKDFRYNELIGANGSMIMENNEISLIKYIDVKTIRDLFKLVDEFGLDYIVDYDWAKYNINN